MISRNLAARGDLGQCCCSLARCDARDFVKTACHRLQLVGIKLAVLPREDQAAIEAVGTRLGAKVRKRDRAKHCRSDRPRIDQPHYRPAQRARSRYDATEHVFELAALLQQNRQRVLATLE